MKIRMLITFKVKIIKALNSSLFLQKTSCYEKRSDNLWWAFIRI